MNTAPRWMKSSYSSPEGGNCVEVAAEPTTIHVRDSKNLPATGPVLQVAPTAWAAFLGLARRDGRL
ncbi:MULTISPECIES: DUF397 domain-containing protein [unclassified Streptomyces]|uniref:DUF397 domain-containing protein n=1 Tax=unclassified Streptomyces TaxID=2593676 RepID=UPI0038189F19